MLSALVVDDDPAVRLTLAEIVKEAGFHVETADNLQGARRRLQSGAPAVLLLDQRLPDGEGLDLLDELEDRSSTEVVLISAHGKGDAVRALQLGASHFLEKPLRQEKLESLLRNVTRAAKLKMEVRELRGTLRGLGHFGSMLGRSAAMQRIYDEINRVAPTDMTVLIVGESGTGKELVAENIHRFSRRRERPFLPINCGAMAPNLIESELFGHERGSFTGAQKTHRGHFERADGGTLFLDEITEMPLELQVKLLRVLETGTILRTGGTRQIELDVRVIAATNNVPEEAVAEGKLREDLFYRLNVFPIHVPPLRERPDDIELLAGHILAELNKAYGTSKKLSAGGLDVLQQQPWPGNVRQFKNVLQRAFVLAEREIDRQHLGTDSAAEPPSLPPGDAGNGGYLLDIRPGMRLAEVERRLIFATLDLCDGNKRRAAEKLGVSVRTLYNRLSKYGSA